MCSYRKQPICLYLIEPIRFWVPCTKYRAWRTCSVVSKWAEWNTAKCHSLSPGRLPLGKSVLSLTVRESTSINEKLPGRRRASLISAPQNHPPRASWEMKCQCFSAGSPTRHRPPPTATTSDMDRQVMTPLKPMLWLFVKIYSHSWRL